MSTASHRYLNDLQRRIDALLIDNRTEYYYNLDKFPAPTSQHIMRIEYEGANRFIHFHGAKPIRDMNKIVTEIIIPRKLNAHEVPREFCKLPIDLDIPVSVLDSIPTDALPTCDGGDWTECDTDDINEAKTIAIKDVVLKAFTTAILAVCRIEPRFIEATRDRDTKFSSHYICENMTTNKETQKHIYSMVVGQLQICSLGKHILDNAICDDIYGKRSLAMVGSYKDQKYQLIKTGDSTYEQYFLNNTQGVIQIDTPECVILERETASSKTGNVAQLANLNHALIFNAVEGHRNISGKFTMAGEKKGRIYLQETATNTNCDICKRKHDKCGWSYLSTSGTYGVWLRCWRQPKGTKGIRLMSPGAFNEMTRHDNSDDVDDGDDDDDDENTASKPQAKKDKCKPEYKPELLYDRLRRYVKYAECFPQFYNDADSLEFYADDDPHREFKPQCITYDERFMKPYPTDTDLYIKANMNSGKTYQLVEYLTNYIDSMKDEADHETGLCPVATVCMVSFRRTFTTDNMRRFKGLGITSYREITGEINPLDNPVVIVQVESLGRIRGKYDIVVIDEAESVADQFFSDTMRDGRGASGAFTMLLESANIVVVLDANLSPRVCDYVSAFRVDKPATIIRNTRTSGDYTDSFTTSKPLIMSKVLDALDRNEKIAIAMTVSTEQSTALTETLKRKYPDKSIKLYNKQTPQSEKDNDFMNLNAAWADVDILIYTPTLQAGISYEIGDHFERFFGMFSSNSTNVDSARQMIHRVRNFKIKDYTILLTGRFQPVWYDSINEYMAHLSDNSTSLQKVPSWMPEEPRQAGKIVRISETPIFKMFCDTKVKASRDQRLFISNFLKAEHNSGVKLKILEADIDCEILKGQIYNAVRFTPLLQEKGREGNIPEYKQFMEFMKSHQVSIANKIAKGDIDKLTHELIQRYEEAAHHLVLEDKRRLKADSKDLPEVKRTAMIKEIQKELKQAELVAMSAFEMPRAKLIDSIKNRIENGGDVSPEEMLKLRLYNMATLYDTDPVPSDVVRNTAYVKEFSKPTTRRMYRNLEALDGFYFSNGMLETQIQQLQLYDHSKHTELIRNGELTQHIRTIEKANGSKFASALEILKTSGFNGLKDTSVISRTVLQESFTVYAKRINEDKNMFKNICADFGKKKSRINLNTGDPLFLRHMLGFANPILSLMFGVRIGRISKNRAGADKFVMIQDHAKYFTLDAEGVDVCYESKPRNKDDTPNIEVFDVVDNVCVIKQGLIANSD